ncbi:MAG: hypothetical protein ACLQAT_04095 [Candidatus Binataceae bacterium]
MPASQIHELYKPSFSIAVPPEADLGGNMAGPHSSPAPGAAPAPVPPSGGGSGETPFNTEEIGPSSMGAPAAEPATASTGLGVPVTSMGAASTDGAGALDASRAALSPATP